MVGIHSEVGNYRKNNQDYVGYFQWGDGGIYVVADGMGGYAGGEVASKIAVDTVIAAFKEEISSAVDDDFIRKLVNLCNEAIIEKGKIDESLRGMGTTLTLCYLNKNKGIVANVGDSCCYILSRGEFYKITKDHSLVQAFVDSGNLTEEEAKKHPNKNIITRSLGTTDKVESDIYFIDVDKNDKIMLCTDGLSNHIDNDVMRDVLLRLDTKEAVKELVHMSKNNGSKDNISVMVFKGECQDDR
ncbi:Stp1/IreP family PP2C-type Ser/Thr phosphatase [Oceanirhabdus sp. W0125-5]|uniref:Stp1/IreP family PP2C-type Ser/Thr phosphatase n=1 Tax=Oceanirhabdus sp. W0125-5 TaxID=2999116 RepID=UPI0022F2A7A6|nr:Stp1/IreP family PP2C-type Ser/Thr phosphatase [Oceanirhabdus sp. W0125-5]WBW94784.1 Stp1/IreP family PP2C-type Ser/Thr phosphatase [Oceanirhabdus sp. W0125-5]